MRDMEGAETARDVHLQVTSNIQRSKSPTTAQKQDPCPQPLETLPRGSSPTVAMKLGSQCTLGAGGQRMKHGSPPWRDRRRHGQSLLGLCIQIPAPKEITDHSSVLILSALPSPKRH